METLEKNKGFKIINGSNLDVLPTLEDNSIDRIITDPPYELGFMGKKWDSTGIAYNVELWKQALRVLKPCGYLLAFGGSRTFHRMACAIEDAGFEIRDTIMWIYGSGFPKSHNIGLAIDKLNGIESKVVGTQIKGSSPLPNNHKDSWCDNQKDGVIQIKEAQNEWKGWGSQLKPAHEDICLAQKPFEFDTEKGYNYIIKEIIVCLLKSFVKIVEKSSMLNQVEQKKALDFVATNVENLNKVEDLLEMMVMLNSISTENMCWNIGILWLNILTDLWKVANISITSTELKPIIELKTLYCVEWENIFQNIIDHSNNKTLGMKQSVLIVENTFNAVKLKLNYIHEHFVVENATLKVKEKDLLPNLNPIIMARKPTNLTIAENCLKYGVGGLNIDECRVPLEEDYKAPIRSEESANNQNERKGQTQCDLGKKSGSAGASENGRFPANVITDGSDEVASGMPNSKGGSGKPFSKDDYEIKETATNFSRGDFIPYNDDGSAMRYFYQAKASKKDRDEGLDMMENSSIKKNVHTTVKPIELMQYLVRLVAPKNATILDIFNGSGSTGKAVAFENRERNTNYKYIGIELEKQYCEISELRIDYAINKYEYDIKKEIDEKHKQGKVDIFDFDFENEK